MAFHSGIDREYSPVLWLTGNTIFHHLFYSDRRFRPFKIISMGGKNDTRKKGMNTHGGRQNTRQRLGKCKPKPNVMLNMKMKLMNLAEPN